MLPVVCGLIVNEAGELLLCQRPEGKAQAGLWEFPGGKVDPGESERQALERELLEELGCAFVIGEALTPQQHEYATLSIRLIPFLCASLGQPRALEHSAIKWVRVEEVMQYPLAPADIPIFQEYVRRFGSELI